MKNKLFCLLAISTLAFACNADQSQNAGSDCEAALSELQAIDQLVKQLYALSPFEESAIDSISTMNEQVAAQLQAVLACPASRQLDLTDAFNNLGYTQTDDGRIRNFSWYTNNGGTWQMFNCVYQYFPNEKTAKTVFVESMGGAGRFFQLNAEPPVYLGFGVEKTCSTCFDEYAELFSFRNDTLHIETVIGFSNRMGSMVDFDFDETTKTLHFTVAIDDMNEELKEKYPTYPISELGLDPEDLEMMMMGDDEDVVAIVDSLVWDGRKFK